MSEIELQRSHQGRTFFRGVDSSRPPHTPATPHATWHRAYALIPARIWHARRARIGGAPAHLLAAIGAWIPLALLGLCPLTLPRASLAPSVRPQDLDFCSCASCSSSGRSSKGMSLHWHRQHTAMAPFLGTLEHIRSALPCALLTAYFSARRAGLLAIGLGPDLHPGGSGYLLFELYALVCGLGGSGAVDGDRSAFECVDGRCRCAGPDSHVRVARTTLMYNG